MDVAAVVNISNFNFYVNDFSLEFQFQSCLEEIFQAGQQQNKTNVFLLSTADNYSFSKLLSCRKIEYFSDAN